MIRFTFKRGLRFHEGTVIWSLTRRLLTGKFELINQEGEIKVIEPAELNRRWLRREYVIDESSLSAGNIFFLAAPPDINSLSEPLQKIVRNRHRYITEIKVNAVTSSAELKARIQEVARSISDASPPSISTLNRWWRRFRHTQCITSLLPYYDKRGRTISQSKHQIFLDVINELPDEERYKIKSIHERMELLITRINNQRPEKRQLPPSLATVYRWYHKLDMSLMDKKRLGTAAHEHKYRATYRSAKAARPLSRIEIDHTCLDVIVYDRDINLPLGRPWLTIALDRRTRMIIGFYISFNSPSAYSVLQCIKRAMLPKEGWLEKVGGITHDWLAAGIPQLIVVDNGMDLHSDALKQLCLDMGIQIAFCRPRTPWWKGAVERFFRTCNSGLIHLLPGTTFSNTVARGDYPSEKLAAIDSADLEWLLTKWIVDVYHQTPIRRLHLTPQQSWQQETKNQIIELPANLAQLDSIIGIPETRTVFNYGIQLHGNLFYNTPQLQTLRNKTGGNPTISLKYSEDTIASIQVFDEEQKLYFDVPIIEPLKKYADGMTLDMHRIVQSYLRENSKDPKSRENQLEAKAELQERIRLAVKDKKMRERKKARAIIETLTAAQNQDPQQAQSTLGNAPVKPPFIISEINDNDVPHYESISEAW